MSKSGCAVLILGALALGYGALYQTVTGSGDSNARHYATISTTDGDSAAGDGRGGDTDEHDDRRRDAPDAGRSAGGVGCTLDCGGHEAGRGWAAAHAVNDPSQCDGHSSSFVDGCESYVREQQGTGAGDGDAPAVD